MYVPVVEAAGVLQALVHSAVDGGLSSFPRTFDQVVERHETDLLPQGNGGEKVAAQLGADDPRVKAVRRHTSAWWEGSIK